MAQDIVGGLFGITPYDVSSNYINQDVGQAMQFAQLTPQQQGQYGLFMGGAGLGRALGNALGGGDPAMKQAQQMQQVKQWVAENGIDLNTPDGLRRAAVFANQIGSPEGASFFGRQAISMEAQQAELGLKKAQTVKALREPVGTADERARNYLVDIERRLANGEDVSQSELNQAALIMQDISKPKSFFDPSSGQMITQPGINPLQSLPTLAQKTSGVQGTGKPAAQGQQGGNANVTQYPGGVTTTQVTQPKMDAKIVSEISDIDSKLPTIDLALKNISDVKATIGRLDLGLLQNTGRGVLAYGGSNTEDRISFDKAYRTVQKAANEMLLLAKGTQTEGDAQRAYDAIMNPNTWKNAEALQAAFNDLEEATKANKTGLMNKRNTLQSGGRNPVQKQAKPSRAAALNRLKELNPNTPEDALNKKLDQLGY